MVSLRADTAQGAGSACVGVYRPPLCDLMSRHAEVSQHTSLGKASQPQKLRLNLAKVVDLWRFNTRAISATGTFACPPAFNSVDVFLGNA